MLPPAVSPARPALRTIGTRLLLAVLVPAVVLAASGTIAAWQQTDRAVREKSRTDAIGLAEFVANSFAAVEDTPPGTAPRVAHRAVTNAVRSNWSALKLITDLRVVGRDGKVKWSRRIEEEDKTAADAERLLGVREGTATFGRSGWFPWSSTGGGEVVYPLGGVACGGCHTGESTLRTGVLQLSIDEPALRTEVGNVFTNASWFITLFVLVIGAVIVLAVRAFVARPIARLAAIMKRAEDGELVVRAPDLGRDELGALATAFNRMLARLTDLKAVEIDTQRDLAHARTELELKEELERRVAELQILYDLARTIASSLQLEEVLSRVAQVVPVKLSVPKFSLMLLNADGLLEVKKAHPPNMGSEGLTFSIGEGVCGRAAELRKSWYVADLEADGLFRVRGTRGEREKGSLLAVPMVRGGELLGVLNFERPQKADFGPAEIEFFSAVADQVGLAVQNARLHEQTVALSITDPLTGVANRRQLFAQLEQEIARAVRYEKPMSLIMIDIDHFKHLNDTAGHSAGDEVLREVCARLRTNLRKVDLLARYGGEEFVVLLPQVGPQEAWEVGEKLRRAVADTPLMHGETQPGGKVTISVGVASLPRDAVEQARLVDCADSALYASKRAGRNACTAYAEGMENDPTRQRGPRAKERSGERPALQRPPSN
ncbi:MAG: diguanylate cyclase [Myxococcaceae bacterium]